MEVAADDCLLSNRADNWDFGRRHKEEVKGDTSTVSRRHKDPVNIRPSALPRMFRR